MALNGAIDAIDAIDSEKGHWDRLQGWCAERRAKRISVPPAYGVDPKWAVAAKLLLFDD